MPRSSTSLSAAACALALASCGGGGGGGGAGAAGGGPLVAVAAAAGLPGQGFGLGFGGGGGGGGAAVVPPPLAQAALWAASLPELRLCDRGIDDRAEGCPARPEHGGAGFLSTVFTWRYALNNVRALLAASAAPGAAPSPPPPQGAAEAVVEVLLALDQLMERPLIDAFAGVTQAARGVFESLRPWLSSASPAPALSLPPCQVATPAHWTWPSDGRSSLGLATFQLRTGAQMPAVGFGTWRLWAKDAYQPVRWALEVGYRHIDTAEGYANEAEIGRAIKDSGVPREEIFLATKASSVPKGLADPAMAEEIFLMQLQQLGTDYVDVYMLHTPPQDPAQLRYMWSVLERLYYAGRARAIGLSNCDASELREVLSFAQVPPAYVQNLFKIYKPGEQIVGDQDLVALAHANQIAFMGYSVQTEWPHIMHPLQDPHVLTIAAQVQRTPSQVLHRWALQRGVGVIPKASSRARIAENAGLFNFELPEAAMRLLDGLSTLSESGAAAPAKPRFHEDVYGLSALMLPAEVAASPTAAEPAAGSADAAFINEPLVQEALAQAREVGFPFAAIQNSLLGEAVNVPPVECLRRCLEEPRCAAWEVCAPVDTSAGCGGCLLIGGVPSESLRISGWHAGVVRAG